MSWERHSEIIQHPAFLNSSSTDVSAHRWNRSNNISVIFQWWFPIPPNPSASIKWHSSVKNNCPLLTIYSCNYLFLSLGTHKCWFYSMGYSPIMPVFLILLILSQPWPLGVLPDWLLCPFCTHSFFHEHNFTFWHHRILQAYLLFSLSQPWNEPLFQRALVPFIGECPPCRGLHSHGSALLSW